VPNPYVFYLLPSLYDQARAVVDFLASRDAARLPRLAVICGGTAFDQDVVDGLRSQAAVHGLKIVSNEREAPSVLATVLALSRTTWCLPEMVMV